MLVNMKKDKCIVPLCESVPRKNGSLKFITFPSNTHKRKLWFHSIGLDSTTFSQKRRLHVCEKHFQVSFII